MAHIRLASSYSQKKPIENPKKKMWLFKDGDEYIDNTGGWEKATIFNGNPNNNTSLIEGDLMKCQVSSPATADFTEMGMQTVNKINLTNLDYLVVDVVAKRNAGLIIFSNYKANDSSLSSAYTGIGLTAAGKQIISLSGLKSQSWYNGEVYIMFLVTQQNTSIYLNDISAISANNIVETLSFVKGGQQTTNFNITSTDYTSQGGNVIQPTIIQRDGYVELETTHINANDPWWDVLLYNTLTEAQITAIKQSNHCVLNADFISPDGYSGSMIRLLSLYNGLRSAIINMLFDTNSNPNQTVSQDFNINLSNATFDRIVFSQQQQQTVANRMIGTYKIRIRDLYFYWKG